MKKALGLVALATLLLLLSACGFGSGKIAFGTGDLEEGITDKKDSFSPDENILIEVETAEAFGTNEIKLVTVQKSGDLESLHEEWYETVEPNWDYMLYEFHNMEFDDEFEPGEYILRIYVDESEMVAEGGFKVE